MTQSAQNRIGLALSGGGARCLAHVGALKALEEAGFVVDAIAANSSAAIIAAIYATVNDAAELERIIRQVEFVKLLDLGASNGLSSHDGIRDLLRKHAAGTFEELAIPLAVPAVDIKNAELIVYSRGNLHEPVCASNAFPGLFTPVFFGGRHLVDGGVINNFPVDVIRTLTACPVVAIDVRTPLKSDLQLEEEEEPPTLLGKVGALFGRNGGETVDILSQAYIITQDRLVQVTMAMHPPDFLLKPALPEDLGSNDFGRMDEAIQIGYDSARAAIGQGQLFSRA